MRRLLFFIEDLFWNHWDSWNHWDIRAQYVSRSRIVYELRRQMDRHDKNEGDLEGIRDRYRKRGSFQTTGVIVQIGSRYKEEIERG